MIDQAVRGPLLVPNADGTVTYHRDGLLASDAENVLQYVGDAVGVTWPEGVVPRPSDGVMLPPLLDIHTHISQHPIRGDFVKGVPDNAPEGKLLAGLKKNVFPAELRCAATEVAERVVRSFFADTRAHGVVGGATYMTTSPTASEVALSELPDTWSVGLVLMNQNCPEPIHTQVSSLPDEVERLAHRFGRRLIITDRFAVAVDTPLRCKAAHLAGMFGLRTQTHLNEQLLEKTFVETALYPQYASYTDVYRRDGLLDHECILAHCIQMSPAEWDIVAATGSIIAHCPTSNLLLGSGVMPLDEVVARRLPYALATDVGASPTVSMLAEMKRFLTVHQNLSDAATPPEALFRATRAPAELLHLSDRLGRLEAGRPLSFIEVQAEPMQTVEETIIALLPDDMNNPAPSVNRVIVEGRVWYQRSLADA